MATGDVRLTEVWTPSFESDIRKFTAGVARQALEDEQAVGFERDPIVIVDRVYGASPDDVKAFGKIEYAARVDIREAAGWVFEQLYLRSPFDTGRFQDSLVMMINGATVTDLSQLKPDDRIQFTDLQPYAGKIERGESLMAPNGIFRAVASAAKGRFKSVFIDFNWVKLDLNVRAKTMSKRGVAGTRAVQYPSISLYQSQENSADGAAGGV